MTVQVVTVTVPDTHLGQGRTLLATNASPMLNSDSITPIPTLGFDEGSVFVSGTFGAGGSVAVEGSADGVTYAALPGISGAIIAITAAGLTVVPYLAARLIRTRVTAGDGTTSLTATILLRTRSRGLT